MNLIIIATTVNLVVAVATSSHTTKDEFYCKEMKAKFNIEPGQSFGSLPFEKHSEYLQARCYRFFCEPHEMAEKGKFPCKPLIKSAE